MALRTTFMLGGGVPSSIIDREPNRSRAQAGVRRGLGDLASPERDVGGEADRIAKLVAGRGPARQGMARCGEVRQG
jgi:hypothetical protein